VVSKDGKQVRLDPDVQAALERDVERKGGSLSSAANQRLRAGLGLAAGGRKPRGRASERAATGAQQTTIASAAGRRTANATPSTCPHPVARRIGERCGACGSAIPRR
jgi:hypothetical protein